MILSFTDGRTVETGTDETEAAIAVIRRELPLAQIAFDGQRWHVWPDLATADGFDSRKAVARLERNRAA